MLCGIDLRSQSNLERIRGRYAATHHSFQPRIHSVFAMPQLCPLPWRQRARVMAVLSSTQPALRRHRIQQPTVAFTQFSASISGCHRAVLLANAGPHATSFASTHAHRDYDPFVEGASDSVGTSKNAAAQSSTRVRGIHEADRSQAEQFPSAAAASAGAEREDSVDVPTSATSSSLAMAHPYSARAYRARLQHGSFASLRELTRAAYAPSPLTVLVDLLRLSVSGLPTRASAAPPSTLRARHALSRALDVAWVVTATVAEARDVVLAAETVGDAASHAALQELMTQMEIFANAIEDCVRGVPADSWSAPQLSHDVHIALPLQPEADESTKDAAVHEDDFHDTCNAGSDAADAAMSPWVLPTATHATLLRGVLQLAAMTGSQLHALTALEELIALHERHQRSQSRRTQDSAIRASDGLDRDKSSVNAGEEEESFSMDDALALVDAAAQRHVTPLAAQDHLYAMQACASEHHRDFHTALSLYRRFVQHVRAGRFAATSADFTAALIALAGSSRTTTDFAELRALLVESEAASTVPVSVALYTSLIDAASRATEEPQRMAIALSLYRRLRDGALQPTADTYAALIACCASTREPTHAFAFYHEARAVCGVASFSPKVYTNLLMSYAAAGYGADARATLDVLVEAGAPLTRASFHAALASAVTVREAQEMVELMTDRYHITPTPHTYAYVVRAVARAPAGVETALQLFDVHEDALRALARISATAPTDKSDNTHNRHHNDVPHAGNVGRAEGGVAVSSSADGVALEPLLLQHYPLYVRAVEHALMRLRVDPLQDPRLKAYLSPLIRVAQQRMNAFAGMPPQAPIRVPDRERLCIAVLAADVLANVDEWVMPFMSHYSVLVIPYSALVALQRGGGRRVDGAMAKGAAAGLHDPVWQETAGGSEQDAVVEHRRRRLMKFLADHREVVHLMSLEEELRWSRETRRYGIGITDLFARAAAVALHLARRADGAATSVRAVSGLKNQLRYDDDDGLRSSSEGDSSSVYARHEQASIVLVSTNYAQCGKYVVALKQAQRTAGGSAGLRAALRRVSYHNPQTNPNWVPPTLSITRQQREQRRQEKEVAGKKQENGFANAAEDGANASVDAAMSAHHGREGRDGALDVDAASELYRRLLHPASQEPFSSASAKPSAREQNEAEGAKQDSISGTGVTHPARLAAAKEEDELDAELLMSFMNE